MMPNVLVDTDVFSFFFKGDSRAALYDKHLRGQRLHLCFVTVAELYRWAVLKGWGKRRIDDLQTSLRNYIVIPYDEPMAWQWARVMSVPGHPMAPGDARIAAAAIRYGLPLVTHNRRHYEPIPGMTVISEA